MKRTRIFLFLFLILGLWQYSPGQGKKRKSSKKSSQKEAPFKIDFSKFQTDYNTIDPDSGFTAFEGEDSVFVYSDSTFIRENYLSDSLRLLMDTLSKLNQRAPFQGYRIVLYTGPDRQKALITKGKAMKYLSDNTKIYYNYERPYFRVKIGNYFDRLTAYPTFVRLKKVFPKAILVPEPITIRKIQFD
jgi:hypothetical protein